MRRVPFVTLAFMVVPAAVAVTFAQSEVVNRAPNPWPVIDNARVHVTFEDASGPPVAGGTVVRVSLADGSVTSGAAPGGSNAGKNSDPRKRTVVIRVKDAKVAPLSNTSGYPAAFPRPASKKVLETDRVVVWDYTWTAGVPTPTHFHDKDVVVVYLEDGALKSTEPSGQSVINEHYFGFTKFNPRNRVHTEELTRGRARAIIVELK